jgi:hypothetical protein
MADDTAPDPEPPEVEPTVPSEDGDVDLASSPFREPLGDLLRESDESWGREDEDRTDLAD